MESRDWTMDAAARLPPNLFAKSASLTNDHQSADNSPLVSCGGNVVKGCKEGSITAKYPGVAPGS